MRKVRDEERLSGSLMVAGLLLLCRAVWVERTKTPYGILKKLKTCKFQKLHACC
jgi:hypothetical protein